MIKNFNLSLLFSEFNRKTGTKSPGTSLQTQLRSRSMYVAEQNFVWNFASTFKVVFVALVKPEMSEQWRGSEQQRCPRRIRRKTLPKQAQMLKLGISLKHYLPEKKLERKSIRESVTSEKSNIFCWTLMRAVLLYITTLYSVWAGRIANYSKQLNVGDIFSQWRPILMRAYIIREYKLGPLIM